MYLQFVLHVLLDIDFGYFLAFAHFAKCKSFLNRIKSTM